jgi:endonuclease/exonuclease/phosphatase (EEP) superfamily protein YafD
VAGVSVATVVALPFVARLLDHTADSITSPGWLVVGWVVLASLAATVVVHVARMVLRLPSGGGFALAYDCLPHALLLAWAVLLAAAVTGHWLLVVTAAGLCGYHLWLVVPRNVMVRRPKWTKHAHRFELGVANVFIDNATPERAAASLVATGLDVLVINESNEAFLTAFEQVGGNRAYPHRLHDPTDTSGYAITVVSRLPFHPDSRFVMIGPLRAAEIRLELDGTPLTLLAIHAYASLEQHGYVVWEAQMRALREYLGQAPHRVVMAGDFNTTHFRPEFMELLATGARDAHDTLGRGWSASLKLRASGLLSSLGPVARLDHALLTEGIWPMDVRNLPAHGSDHLPFVLSVAVRPQAKAA